MKILQLTFSLTSGGGEKLAVDLANKLSEDHEVFFCVILSEKYKIHSFFKSQLSPKINYINLDSLKGINIKLFISIYKLIIKIKPDVVHFHLNTILYLYIPAFFFRSKINFIHTLHSVTSKTIGFKWQKSINKYFYQNNLIKPVVISKNNLDTYIEFYNNNNNVTLIENGVAKPTKSKEFNKVQKEISKLKEKESEKILIHIGGYLEAKNQRMLVKVLNRLINENRKVILIVIGKYFDSEEAKELIKNSNKRIFYLGTKSNVSDYLLNSDVFVLSSLWEGLPISLLEALSCGVVPVCTPAGGIPEVIKNKTIGFVSHDFSEEEYYKSLIKCLDNIDSFEKTTLINYFIGNFSIDTCANKYMKLYLN